MVISQFDKIDTETFESFLDVFENEYSVENSYKVIKKFSNDDWIFNQNRNFEDFLKLKDINIAENRIPSNGIIPSEKIKSTQNTLEIHNSSSCLQDFKTKPDVVLKRNEENEIYEIEVQCSCGEKINIKIDYTD